MGDNLLHRVELHVHLDGCLRHQTIWDLRRSKGLELPGDGRVEDVREAVRVRQPRDLEFFLRGYKWILPAVTDDLDAVRRVCLEFCQDSAAQGIAYTEVRYSPHLLLSGKSRELTPADVVDAVCTSLKEGEERYGPQVRSLLCCIRKEPQWAPEVARLCDRFRDRGVVGIDIAGDEKGGIEMAGKKKDGEMFDPLEIAAFQEVGKLGLGRTVHAGEDGPAEAVKQGVEKLGATRIGHGYHTVDDAAIYADTLRRRTHFEACPVSSWITGSVPKKPEVQHPIKTFALDGANFSINRDGSTISMMTLNDEMDVLRSWGLQEAYMTRAAFNAANSCFLDKEEKARLIRRLENAYGMDN